jgi:hypothetical protein
VTLERPKVTKGLLPHQAARLTTNIPPLPLGEGWGEGYFHLFAQKTANFKQQLLTNWLNRLRFLSTTPSHASNKAIMIAKRQSTSGESVMAAMVAISRVKSSELGAATQGR